jgi:hypothetical protein
MIGDVVVFGAASLLAIAQLFQALRGKCQVDTGVLDLLARHYERRFLGHVVDKAHVEATRERVRREIIGQYDPMFLFPASGDGES